MYAANMSGMGPFQYLKPSGTPKDPTQYPKDYRCDDCDVRWSTTNPDQQCWICGGQTEEESDEPSREDGSE